MKKVIKSEALDEMDKAIGGNQLGKKKPALVSEKTAKELSKNTV